MRLKLGQVQREPDTEHEKLVGDTMTDIGKLIDQRLQGEYGGVVLFVKIGADDEPHEFFVQSPMTQEMVIWALRSALSQLVASHN